MKTVLLKSLLIISSITSFAQCPSTVYTGDGTYYDYTDIGNCSFPGNYSTLYAAAINAAQYSNAALCGACAEVTGPNGTLTVVLEDQCPECIHGDLDFESNAFPFIADPILGRVSISWKIVPCPVTGPIGIYFKEGSNPWWMAVQVRNHHTPIQKVELKYNGGEYQETTRESYNYFIKNTENATVLDFRITDIFGSEIEMLNVTFQESSFVAANQQFPGCTILGTTSTDKKGIKVFPNPSTDFTVHISTMELVEKIEVYDKLGNAVNADIHYEGNSGKIMFPSEGSYIIRITSGQSVSVSTVIVY